MKTFECKPICRNNYIESVTLGCPDCIKKTELVLTEPQRKSVEKVLSKYKSQFFRFK